MVAMPEERTLRPLLRHGPRIRRPLDYCDVICIFTKLVAAIEARPFLKAVVFLMCLAIFGGPAFLGALRAADRYAHIEKSDWVVTNVWLKSAECARQTGAWLALCEGDKLIPINEQALADDPGHAFILDVYASLTGRSVDLVDVTRLNAFINAAGFVAVAAFLAACRAYAALLVFLILGPFEYLGGWTHDAPHWSFVGATSLAAILPLAVLARHRSWLSPPSANAFLALGLLGLGAAALIREAVGLMALVITAAVIAGLFIWKGRLGQRRINLVVLAGLVLLAWSTPRWVILARDWSFAMEPPTLVQSHGLSHSLYIYLIAAKKGAAYASIDTDGEEAARAADPGIVFYSPEYYRLMWRLYIRLVLDDPEAALRVYLAKGAVILGDSLLEPAPPLWLSILAAAGFVLFTWPQWPKLDFDQGRFIMIVCLAFVALFVAQGILTFPSRLYAFPAGRLLLVLLACAVEFVARTLWRRFTTVSSGARS
jgi:hypothetical protein